MISKRPKIERSVTVQNRPAANEISKPKKPASKTKVNAEANLFSKQNPENTNEQAASENATQIDNTTLSADKSEVAGNDPKNVVSSDVTASDGNTHSDERISRDERNLATYPIALLSYQARRDKTISQTRERRHPLTKKLITATWEVLGSEKWGLPTPTDDAVVLVLLEISREMGFPQEVYFTQRDILNRLGWPDNRDHYRKLETVFHRLNAITIQSKNVFWDSTAKAFVNTGFHLLESFEIISKPGRQKSANQQLPLSRFVWGEVLWKSFREGNLKPISLSFYFGLNLPVSRRLFRFLDLVRYDGKPKYRIGLRKLCEEFLCLSEAKYPSTYKNTLAPGHEELIRAGYLLSVAYESAKTGGENVVYEFGSLPSAALPSAALPTPGSDDFAADDDEMALTAMPNALDIALSLEASDEKSRRMACDAILEALPYSDKENLHRRALGALAPFLRDKLNSTGARLALQREIHQLIELEHAPALRLWLQEHATTQILSEH